MNELPQSKGPELIFGLVAPIGVDLEHVTNVLYEALKEMNYSSHVLKLTRLMRELEFKLPLNDQPYIQSFKERITYANAIRQKYGSDALAVLAISAIRSYRSDRNNNHPTETHLSNEEPLNKQAYIIRQLKRPEEVKLLRSVYGRQFILVSAYAPEDFRIRNIAESERASCGGTVSYHKARQDANDLVAQDSKEEADNNGQNVRDAFPLGDVFIDVTNKKICENTVRRFVRLFFGNNEITPTRDEYGMYVAKTASLRSSDLSRQVGAAICRPSGEIITLGCNEVPKYGGGTYWENDSGDSRDFVKGFDANDRYKIEVLTDLIRRLQLGGHLAVNKELSLVEIMQMLNEDKSENGVSASRLMDIIEFGRIIHAEMCAICDAARLGISILNSTLICTTFPCHICAKHIVASGISRVVFLEPYPKSYAFDLHKDSISVGEKNSGRVSFEPFIGVSPFRYRDLFEKGKKKYTGGSAQSWNKGERNPMIEVYYPSYFKSETHVVNELRKSLDTLGNGGVSPSPSQSV